MESPRSRLKLEAADTIRSACLYIGYAITGMTPNQKRSPARKRTAGLNAFSDAMYIGAGCMAKSRTISILENPLPTFDCVCYSSPPVARRGQKQGEGSGRQATSGRGKRNQICALRFKKMLTQ